MPIPEAILNQMKCGILNDGHIAIEPIQLSCGANGCKKCISSSKDDVIKCFACNGEHQKRDVINSPINKLGETMVHTFLNDLLEYVDNSLKKSSDLISGILYLVTFINFLVFIFDNF